MCTGGVCCGVHEVRANRMRPQGGDSAEDAAQPGDDDRIAMGENQCKGGAVDHDARKGHLIRVGGSGGWQPKKC